MRFEPNRLYTNTVGGISLSGKWLLEYTEDDSQAADIWEETDIVFEPGVVYVHKSNGTTVSGERLLVLAYEGNTPIEYFADMVPSLDASIGKKFDGEKPDWSLMPTDELETVVKIITFGKVKYGRENWKHVTGGFYRYYAAAMRHMAAHKKYMETGLDEHRLDDESGLPHLAHAACNLIFLMWLDNNNAHSFDEDYPMPDWMKDQTEKMMQEYQIGGDY